MNMKKIALITLSVALAAGLSVPAEARVKKANGKSLVESTKKGSEAYKKAEANMAEARANREKGLNKERTAAEMGDFAIKAQAQAVAKKIGVSSKSVEDFLDLANYQGQGASARAVLDMIAAKDLVPQEAASLVKTYMEKIDLGIKAESSMVNFERLLDVVTWDSSAGIAAFHSKVQEALTLVFEAQAKKNNPERYGELKSQDELDFDHQFVQVLKSSPSVLKPGERGRTLYDDWKERCEV